MPMRAARAQHRRPAASTVWPRIAATATASSAVSRSIASHQWSSKLRIFEQAVARAQASVPAPRPAPECSLSIASTSRSKNRRRSDAAPSEQPVHRRRQPHHAQMIAERRRRTRPARGRSGSAGCWRRASLPADRCRCRAWPARARLRPRRTPPRSRRPGCRRHRRGWRGASPRPGDRNEIASMQLVLPAPFGPTSTTTSPRVSQARRAIIAEMREREAMDAGGGHVEASIIHSFPERQPTMTTSSSAKADDPVSAPYKRV